MQTASSANLSKSPQGDCIDWLHHEYCKRRSVNDRYSLRSFAKTLSLSPGLLSGILSRKRPLSQKLGLRIAARLDYGPELRKEFLQRIQKNNIETLKAALPTAAERNFVAIADDSFDLISEWYHNAILSLIETASFQSDPHWIAAKLGISIIEARDAIARLIRVGLVEDHNGVLAGSRHTTTTHNVPSEAIRKSHRQHMQMAAESLDLVDVSERDITCITMSTDASKIAGAKEMIRHFRRELATYLEDGTCHEVYCLNVQLFPLTKTGVQL